MSKALATHEQQIETKAAVCFDCGKWMKRKQAIEGGELDPVIEYAGKRFLGFCPHCRGAVFWVWHLRDLKVSEAGLKRIKQAFGVT